MRKILPTHGSIIVGPNEKGRIGVLDKRAKKDPKGLYLRFKWRHGLRNIVRGRKLERWDHELGKWVAESKPGYSREVKDETVHAGLKAIEEIGVNRKASEVMLVTGLRFRRLPEGWYESAKPVPLVPGMYQRIYGKRF